ncbi:MAG TPA: AAA family ATPase [Lapillicoccus sp.]|nr:AAA family ATPase [Lapillicoccus sp.]
MGWIDTTAWDPAQGKPLVQRLAERYPDEAVVRALLEDAGIPLRFLRTGNVSIELYWRGLAEDLHNNHLLRQLLDRAVLDQPAFGPELAALDRDDEVRTAIPVAERYAMRMLRPGNRPFINRVSLRGRLKQLIEEGYPVLIVRGPERTGKSFSYQLLEQVLPDDVRLVWVDFSSSGSGRSASDLADLLYARFALDRPAATGRRTTEVRRAIELVHHFAATYNRTESGKTILFVDGLNRVDLSRDTLAFVSQLIADVSRGQIKDVQLVLAGYAEQFDASVGALVLVEDVVPLTRTDLQAFFEACAADANKVLEQVEVTAILQTVLADDPTIDELAVRARSEALTLMGIGP